jgi:hypothetical protein
MNMCKKWLNQLKLFLTNIFLSIIWHLFAGESHQVVEITVTYRTVLSSDHASGLREKGREGGGGLVC